MRFIIIHISNSHRDVGWYEVLIASSSAGIHVIIQICLPDYLLQYIFPFQHCDNNLSSGSDECCIFVVSRDMYCCSMLLTIANLSLLVRRFCLLCLLMIIIKEIMQLEFRVPTAPIFYVAYRQTSVTTFKTSLLVAKQKEIHAKKLPL
jgi:hypothetical protein